MEDPVIWGGGGGGGGEENPPPPPPPPPLNPLDKTLIGRESKS